MIFFPFKTYLERSQPGSHLTQTCWAHTARRFLLGNLSYLITGHLEVNLVLLPSKFPSVSKKQDVRRTGLSHRDQPTEAWVQHFMTCLVRVTPRGHLPQLTVKARGPVKEEWMPAITGVYFPTLSLRAERGLGNIFNCPGVRVSKIYYFIKTLTIIENLKTSIKEPI